MSRCEICDADIPGGVDALEMHKGGKRHIKLATHRELMETLQETSIYIHGINTEFTQEEIQKTFIQFGPINRIIFQPKKAFAIVEFVDKGSAQKALEVESVSHTLGLMKIEKRKVDFDFLKKHNTCIDVEEVLDKLQGIADLAKAADILISSVVISATDTEHRKNRCVQLQTHLQKYMEHVQLDPFGSNTTGIGFLDSDMDVHMHFGNGDNFNSAGKPISDANLNKFCSNKMPNICRDKSTLSECVPTTFKNRKLLYEELCQLSNEGRVRLIARIINDVRKTVGFNISPTHFIPDARCPLVRMKIDRSWLLDLSVINFIGFTKTRILSTILAGDQHIGHLKRLLVTFRFWAISNGLCNPPLDNHVGHFNSYILNLIVVYALMDGKVLPTLTYTNSLITDSEWFAPHLDNYPAFDLSKYSFQDLLKIVFTFIGQTKLNECVLCPLRKDVVVISKANFRNDYLGDAINGKKYNKFILNWLNVMDPVEHSHNVAQNVSKEYTDKIRRYARITLSILKNDQSLVEIMNICNHPPSSYHKEIPKCDFHFVMPALVSPHMYNIEYLKIFIEKFVEDIMLWIPSMIAEPDIKRIRIEQEDEQEEIYTSCNYDVTCNVWSGRRSVKRSYLLHHANSDIYEVEKKVSQTIVQSAPKPLQHLFSVYINGYIRDGKAIICFNKVNGEKAVFVNAVHLFQQIISNWNPLPLLSR